MRTLLFNNWSVNRWLRLGFSVFLFTQAYLNKDWMFVIFGLFFLVQVIFNLGCGSNGCSIPNKKNQ